MDSCAVHTSGPCRKDETDIRGQAVAIAMRQRETELAELRHEARVPGICPQCWTELPYNGKCGHCDY